MAKTGKTAGGTPGAQVPGPGSRSKSFQYSEAEWAQIASTLGQFATAAFREELESTVSAYLLTPNVQQRKGELKALQADLREVNRTAFALLQGLRAAGLTHAETSVELMGRDHCLLENELKRLTEWTGSFADFAEDNEPHGNSLVYWRHFLKELCRKWWRAELPVRRGRRFDQTASGPMIDFVVAAAGPVKKLRPPENLSGPMTGEMAYHAIGDFIKSLKRKGLAR